MFNKHPNSKLETQISLSDFDNKIRNSAYRFRSEESVVYSRIRKYVKRRKFKRGVCYICGERDTTLHHVLPVQEIAHAILHNYLNQGNLTHVIICIVNLCQAHHSDLNRVEEQIVNAVMEANAKKQPLSQKEFSELHNKLLKERINDQAQIDRYMYLFHVARFARQNKHVDDKAFQYRNLTIPEKYKPKSNK
jgi:hypothetical protein